MSSPAPRRIHDFLAAALGAAALLLGLLAAPATAAPKGAPSKAAKTSPADAWAAFLSRYLDTSAADGVNRVRYSAVTPGDARALEAWLAARRAEKPSALPPAARKAWWINLYNAQTAAVVLKAWPVKSILDIDLSGPGKDGPWDAKLLEVEGRKLSLNEIENSILRPGFKDARIHFALNCASLGCPELAPLPYDAARLDAMLDKAARAFIDSPHGAEAKDASLRLSSIFDWYKEDFGDTPNERLEWVARFASPSLAARLRAHAGKIEYRYDWALNAAP